MYRIIRTEVNECVQKLFSTLSFDGRWEKAGGAREMGVFALCLLVFAKLLYILLLHSIIIVLAHYNRP